MENQAHNTVGLQPEPSPICLSSLNDCARSLENASVSLKENKALGVPSNLSS
uniref:Deuterosome assembly protein 1 n=1 Tax=Rhinolophus ferrumequinum TaxID=59479 RepID=A0A671G286_RHIFE